MSPFITFSPRYVGDTGDVVPTRACGAQEAHACLGSGCEAGARKSRSEDQLPSARGRYEKRGCGRRTRRRLGRGAFVLQLLLVRVDRFSNRVVPSVLDFRQLACQSSKPTSGPQPPTPWV